MQKDAKNIDEKLNDLISILLRTGVILSVIIIIAGMAVGMINKEISFSNFTLFEPTNSIEIFKTFFTGLKSFNSIAIIQLGLFIMILTPILRLIMAFVGYLFEKDYLYSFISFLVLTVIAMSFFFGLKA